MTQRTATAKNRDRTLGDAKAKNGQVDFWREFTRLGFRSWRVAEGRWIARDDCGSMITVGSSLVEVLTTHGSVFALEQVREMLRGPCTTAT